MGTRRIQYSSLSALAWCAAALGCADDDGHKQPGKDLLGHRESIQFPGPQFPGAGTGSAGSAISAGVGRRGPQSLVLIGFLVVTGCFV